MGDRNYVVGTPDRRTKSRLCHINLLKSYVERSEVSTPVVCIGSEKILEVDDDGIEAVGPIGIHLSNSEPMKNLAQHIKHLSTTQQTDIIALMVDYPELFQDIHGRTTIAIHDVDTGSTLPIKQHPYRLGPVTLTVKGFKRSWSV